MTSSKKARPADDAPTQAVSKDVIQAVLAAADAREASASRQTAKPFAPLAAVDAAAFEAPTARKLNPLSEVNVAPAPPAPTAPRAPTVLAAPIAEIARDPFHIIASSNTAEIDATTVTARHSAAPAARARASRFVAFGVLAAALLLVGTVAVRSVSPGSSSTNGNAPPISNDDLAPSRETVSPPVAVPPATVIAPIDSATPQPAKPARSDGGAAAITAPSPFDP